MQPQSKTLPHFPHDNHHDGIDERHYYDDLHGDDDDHCHDPLHDDDDHEFYRLPSAPPPLPLCHCNYLASH